MGEGGCQAGCRERAGEKDGLPPCLFWSFLMGSAGVLCNINPKGRANRNRFFFFPPPFLTAVSSILLRGFCIFFSFPPWMNEGPCNVTRVTLLSDEAIMHVTNVREPGAALSLYGFIDPPPLLFLFDSPKLRLHLYAHCRVINISFSVKFASTFVSVCHLFLLCDRPLRLFE